MSATLAHLDLNLLVVLDTLLTERSVTRAGRTLGLSQPATSAALARLRRFFDDPLLERNGRRLEPTSVALALREPVRDILQRIESTIDRRPEFDPKSSTREFTLAASDYAVLVLAPALHAALSTDAPNVRLRFVPLELAERDSEPCADLFVIPQAHARGRHEKLFHDRWVFVADRNHPEIGSRLTAAALRRLPFVRYRSSVTTHRSVIASALEAVNFERPAAVTVSNFATALLLIPGTRLVALCQERLIHIARTRHVRILKPPFAIAPLLEVMAWNPVHERDPAHLWLRAMVRRAAATL